MATEEAKTISMTSEQKAAAVVVALGAENASTIYKYLGEEEVERLTVEVAKMNRMDSEQMEYALDDFYKTCLTQKVVTDGGLEYARSVLEKAYGEATASELLSKVTKFLKNRSFEFIRKADSKSLYSILQHERPQTIALVLSYIDPEQAAGVIAELPDDKKIPVVECIATMENVSPEATKLVEAQLRKKFDNILTTDFTTIGGIDYIADVMNRMDRSNEKAIFDEMAKGNPELADTIRKKMFVFEDILSMDDRSVQRFVRDCDIKDLVYALKNASPDMSSLFYRNMSSRMAETIRSDLEVTTNVRLRDVEEAQQRIVNIIRRLEEAGELITNKGGKDDIIL